MKQLENVPTTVVDVAENWRNKIIPVTCEGSDYIAILDLVEFQGDLKFLSKEAELKLINSLSSHGFSFPVFYWYDEVSGQNYMLDGHQRIAVVRRLMDEGFTIGKIPCCKIEAFNREDAKRKLLAVTSQYAEITEDGLRMFLEEDNIDFGSVSEQILLPDIDVDSYLVMTEDPIIEPKLKPERKLELPDPVFDSGDVINLGKHTLVCGDNSEIDFPTANLIFTDPPYGKEYVSNRRKDKFSMIQGDDSVPEIKDLIMSCAATNAPVLVCTDAEHLPHFRKKMMEPKLKKKKGSEDWVEGMYEPYYKQMVIWDKMNHGSGNLEIYGSEYELILIFCKTSYKLLGHRDSSIHSISKGSTQNYIHPTQKPVELPLKYINDFTVRGQTVVDFYGGSGSTLMACEASGRICFCSEICEIFTTGIVERWLDHTENTSITVNGVQHEYIDWKKKYNSNKLDF